MTLDQIIPKYHFNEVHSIRIRASANEVYQALRQLRTTDISPVFSLLFSIRNIPIRMLGRTERSVQVETPIIDHLTTNGFHELVNQPDQLYMFGTIGKFWKLTGDQSVPFSTPEAFVSFETEGFAKVAAAFWIKPEGANDHRLFTETRIIATDEEGSRKRFKRYWRFVYPGSAFIRRLWLRAVKKKSEASS